MSKVKTERILSELNLYGVEMLDASLDDDALFQFGDENRLPPDEVRAVYCGKA